MCPACIASAAILATKAVALGGAATVVVRKLYTLTKNKSINPPAQPALGEQ